jgi:hypothetical protein
MARNNEASTEATETPAGAVAQAGDSRLISLTLDAEAVALLNPAGSSVAGDVAAASYTVGQTLSRKEYVLRRWSQGVARGPISKELTRLQGKPVPYQIVFQAVNKIPGGPAKAAKPEAAPAASE